MILSEIIFREITKVIGSAIARHDGENNLPKKQGTSGAVLSHNGHGKGLFEILKCLSAFGSIASLVNPFRPGTDCVLIFW